MTTTSTAIVALRDLVRFLSSEAVTVDALTARLGRIADDPGPGGTVELTPIDPTFQAVEFARDPDGGAPNVVDLVLAQGHGVTVASLAHAFGPYQETRAAHPGDAPTIVFYVDEPARTFTAAVIAEVEGASGDLAGGTVRALTIRRDPRLG